MTVGTIRTLIVIIQAILLAIQMVTDIGWLCIPIVLLLVVNLVLKEYE